MNKQLRLKLKEACFSVLPITLIILILHITRITPLTNREVILWIVGSAFAILGIGFFALGADIAMTPMGEKSGAGLFQQRNIIILLISIFLLGLLITVAEPDLALLAEQVPIDSTLLIWSVALGVGLILVLGTIKIIFNIKLHRLLLCLYILLFILVFISDKDIIPLAFDSGGITTGPITVPFIMALGLGIATIKGKSEDSFGFVTLTSIGAIFMVLILGIFNKQDIVYTPSIEPGDLSILRLIVREIIHYLWPVAFALIPIVGIFMIINFLILKLPRIQIYKILIGVIYAYIGLVLFLATVEASFSPIADHVGKHLSSLDYNFIVIPISFIIGLVVVLAEPAVHVLNKQVVEISHGRISKKTMLLSMALGVGVAMALSMIRMFLGFNILWYLIIGYALALVMSFIVPAIYSAIAFDSGAVVSGPITAGFILPFTIGVASNIVGYENVMTYAFGIAAIVSMTPAITIQILGLLAYYKEKSHIKVYKHHIFGKNDMKIIYFE